MFSRLAGDKRSSQLKPTHLIQVVAHINIFTTLVNFAQVNAKRTQTLFFIAVNPCIGGVSTPRELALTLKSRTSSQASQQSSWKTGITFGFVDHFKEHPNGQVHKTPLNNKTLSIPERRAFHLTESRGVSLCFSLRRTPQTSPISLHWNTAHSTSTPPSSALN